MLEKEASHAAEGQLIDYPSQDPLQFLDELELVEETEHQTRGDSQPPGPVDYDPDENEQWDTPRVKVRRQRKLDRASDWNVTKLLCINKVKCHKMLI